MLYSLLNYWRKPLGWEVGLQRKTVLIACKTEVWKYSCFLRVVYITLWHLRENKEEKHVLPLKQPETQLLPWTCQKGSYFSNLDLPLEHSYVYYLVRKTSDFPIKFSMCLSSSLVAAWGKFMAGLCPCLHTGPVVNLLCTACNCYWTTLQIFLNSLSLK